MSFTKLSIFIICSLYTRSDISQSEISSKQVSGKRGTSNVSHYDGRIVKLAKSIGAPSASRILIPN